MNTKKYQLESYRKYLLNRVTASTHIVEYVDNCLSCEDEAAKHSFHKIMVHNWAGNPIELFDALSDYFTSTLIPVNYSSQREIITFYTSNLNFVSKVIKLDFMFPHQRNMYNVDILFNDKTSVDCFESRETVEDVVTSVVSNRVIKRKQQVELNLSNFCEDPEFIQKKIHFYKVQLLSHYKILMLRVGRDTKILNLSNNNLRQVPADILNFFIKGDLTAIDLSNNNIPSINELQRISSKIEKLWIEGNPLCENVDAGSYLKQIVVKFPRLTELDGMRLNEHGIAFPFIRNFLLHTDRKTKFVVDRFLTLYFAHYDSTQRSNIGLFYDSDAKLTISTCFNDNERKNMAHYTLLSQNIMKQKSAQKNKMHSGRAAVVDVLTKLPESKHDPGTFTVDVMKHEKKVLILVVDGVYRETNLNPNSSDLNHVLNFRRTFVFKVISKNNGIFEYFITNEIFSISFATPEQIKSSFTESSKSTNPLALINPDAEDADTLSNVFSHLTQLKKMEAEFRLKINDWDIIKTLQDFTADMNMKRISSDRFIEDDDFTDTSSLIDEEID